MKDKRYLITGGCGFVGRNLTRYLIAKEKCDIWIVDDLSIGQHPKYWLEKKYKKIGKKKQMWTYFADGESKITFIHADVVKLLDSEIKDKGSVLPTFDKIFHLASIVGGRELIDGDPILVGRDLAIDAVFFLWLTRNVKSPTKVLYASSSAAYPIHLQSKATAVALNESFVHFDDKMGLPDMTYGWSKLTGEYLSRLTAKQYGIQIACVRPFSGYGEDQDFTYPIPAIARRIAQRENPIMVWGTGKQGRDFVHIDDCINAFFTILDNISDGAACNIGSGKLTTFLEVIKEFANIEAYKPLIKTLPDKPVGVASRYADIKLVNSFGWKPFISNKEGFTRVLSYLKRHRL